MVRHYGGAVIAVLWGGRSVSDWGEVVSVRTSGYRHIAVQLRYDEVVVEVQRVVVLLWCLVEG